MLMLDGVSLNSLLAWLVSGCRLKRWPKRPHEAVFRIWGSSLVVHLHACPQRLALLGCAGSTYYHHCTWHMHGKGLLHWSPLCHQCNLHENCHHSWILPLHKKVHLHFMVRTTATGHSDKHETESEPCHLHLNCPQDAMIQRMPATDTARAAFVQGATRGKKKRLATAGANGQ